MKTTGATNTTTTLSALELPTSIVAHKITQQDLQAALTGKQLKERMHNHIDKIFAK